MKKISVVRGNIGYGQARYCAIVDRSKKGCGILFNQDLVPGWPHVEATVVSVHLSYVENVNLRVLC